MVKQNLFFLMFFLVLLFPKNAASQTLTRGVVEFGITYPDLNENQKKDLDLLPKTMSIYFKDGKSRIELNTILGTTVILADHNTKQSYVLTELMGKKIAMQSSSESIRKIDSENNLKNETQTKPLRKHKRVAGYKCNAVQITSTEHGKTYSYTCYYTPDLPNVSYSVTSDMTKEISGLMLDYSMINNGIRLHIVAQKITPAEYADSYFAVPAEYQIINSDEQKSH